MDDVQRGTAIAITGPRPADIANIQLFSNSHYGFSVDEIPLVIRAKFADDNRQIVSAHKVGKIAANFVVVLVHLVHMNAEDGVLQRVSLGYLRSMIQHLLPPVLPPVGRIHHQSVR